MEIPHVWVLDYCESRIQQEFPWFPEISILTPKIVKLAIVKFLLTRCPTTII